MTATLWPECCEDAEELIVAWMQPLRRSSVNRRSGDPLPFTLITEAIPGQEDEQNGIAEAIVSVHTLCDKELGRAAAKEEAKKTHRRMLELSRGLDTITLTDGRLACVEYCTIFQRPIWVSFEDTQIIRKVGRYRIGLSYVSMTH